MKVNYAGKRFLPGLMSLSLLGIAALAVVALGPGLMPGFGTDGAEALAFNRPVHPTKATAKQQPAVGAGNTTEAVVLANWEFTSTVTNDVLLALIAVDVADVTAAAAVFTNNKKAESVLDAVAVASIHASYDLLAVAAGNARSLALGADAQAMLAVYIKIYDDAKAGNVLAVYQDTLNAETIASKAVLDASPHK